MVDDEGPGGLFPRRNGVQMMCMLVRRGFEGARGYQRSDWLRGLTGYLMNWSGKDGLRYGVSWEMT